MIPTYEYAQINMTRPVVDDDPITGMKRDAIEFVYENRAFYTKEDRDAFVASFDPDTYQPVTKGKFTVDSIKAVKVAQVLSTNRRKAIKRLKSQ